MNSIDFADFGHAFRYTSTPDTGRKSSSRSGKHIAFASLPVIVHKPHMNIDEPFALQQPIQGSIARRRTNSCSEDQSPENGSKRNAVHFNDVRWAEEHHPGTSADVSREDNEAVSPKSRLPGVLGRMINRQTVLERKESRRVGTSLIPLKSPYPRPPSDGSRRFGRTWLNRVTRRFKDR